MSEPSKGGCMASAVHELWMGTFTTRDGCGSSGSNAQRGTCASSPDLLTTWGKGGATWWFETDAGVLLEAKPVAPVETTRTPRVRVVATSGGGGFGKQRLLFAKHRTMLFLSDTHTHCVCVCVGRLNDCECTNTLAQKSQPTISKKRKKFTGLA